DFHVTGVQTCALPILPKMAESPAQVLEFLDDLARRARPFAEKDAQELRAFARDELGIADLQAWDVAYASEKLRAARYAFSDQEEIGRASRRERAERAG